MDLSTLYLILILPNIGKVLGVASLITITLLIVFMTNASFDEEVNESFSKIKSSIKYILLCGFLSVMIPSEKQMMYMIGGYAATNVDGIEKLPKNVVSAANKFLEDFTVPESKDKK